MDRARHLVVTVDTEVDRDREWRISDPVSFDSVCVGIPQLLSPLFDEFGVVPTYLLSYEVIEDPAAASVLRSLRHRAELGTHLHAELVPPDRRLHRSNMAGQAADAVQLEYSREIEEAKLTALTELFSSTFGYRPTSFRAGRFGMSNSTFELLARGGYRVDSSVTPGIRWRLPQGTVDYTQWTSSPSRRTTAAGTILELPVGIQVRDAELVDRVDRLPALLRKAGHALFSGATQAKWLRPSWESGPEMVEYLDQTTDRFLVLMFHSMEVIPGASPYASTDKDVARIIGSLHHLFEHCARHGIRFCSLSEAAMMQDGAAEATCAG